MEKKELFYVGVSAPVEVRRNLLEASKSLIQLLKKFESLKEVRHEKQLAIAKLTGLVKEISGDIGAIKADLPNYKISELPKKKEERPKIAIQPKPKAISKKAKPKIIAPAPKPHRDSEIDRLEKELGSIEAKLSRL